MKYLFLSTALCMIFVALPVLAANDPQPGLECSKNGTCTYTPLEPVFGLTEVQSGNASLSTLMNNAFKVLFSVGALIAVGRLVFAGIVYMTSEVVDKKSEARKGVNSSIYGLLLLAGSWLILYTINPKLLEFNLSLPSNNPSATSASGSSGGPYVNVISIPDNVREAICGGTLCNVLQSVITYDPKDLSNSNVKGVYDKYKSDCESPHEDSQQSGKIVTGHIKTFSGSLVGESGRVGIACVSN